MKVIIIIKEKVLEVIDIFFTPIKKQIIIKSKRNHSRKNFNLEQGFIKEKFSLFFRKLSLIFPLGFKSDKINEYNSLSKTTQEEISGSLSNIQSDNEILILRKRNFETALSFNQNFFRILLPLPHSPTSSIILHKLFN